MLVAAVMFVPRLRMKNVVVHGIMQGCVALEQDVCVNVNARL